MTTYRLLWIPRAVSILLALSSIVNAQFRAATGSPFRVGLGPVSVAVGDFNGDSRQDLAITNQNENTTTVVMGDGSGQFTAVPGSPFPVGMVPQGVAVADFNRDGKPDLVIANSDSNTVSVLLGDGASGFTAAPGSPFPTAHWPHSIAIGDFNGDGKLDLAIGNTNGASVTVLLGNGAGGFAAAPGSPFTVGTQPQSIVTGDFNGDGKLDLAIANFGSNSVTVVLGNGTGRFSAAPGSPVTVGTEPNSAVVGDFNGDGKLDLAIANSGSNNVTLLLGNGTGGFTAASPLPTGTAPASLAIGDFNEDDKLDLAIANSGSNNVTVLLGDGLGGFTSLPGSPFPVGDIPASVAVGDFNGDGKPDLAIANALDNSVTVLLNTPIAPIVSPVPGTTLSGTLADFSWNVVSGATKYLLTVGTSPGASNIFSGTTTATSQTVGFIPCNGGTVYVQLSAQVNGSFQPATDSTYPCKSAIGDFNKDHFQDLLWQNNSSGQVNVNFYAGAGPQPQGSAVLDDGSDLSGWLVVGSGDFDRNGVPDLVLQNQSTGQVNVNYYGAPGTTTLIGSACLSCGIHITGWSVVGVADMDGDGAPDLIYQNQSTSQVNVNYYGGSGGATFQGYACLSCGINVTGWQVKAVADFDGNRVPDLVYQNQSTGQVNVNYYGGSGGATFQGFACLSCGLNITGWKVVGADDWNADGVPDLVYQNQGSGQVNVDYYGGSGGAVFKGWNCLNCAAPLSGWLVRTIAKFGSNGEPNLIWQNTTTNAVSVYYYGMGGGVFQGFACLSCGIDTSAWQLVGSGDFDGNGVPDLVYQNRTTAQVNVDYYGGSGGTTFIGWACLSCGINVTGWQVKAVADFDGNGVPDLVYQNQSTSQVNVNYYGGSDGSAFQSFACLSCGINVTGWQVKAAADFDGNGVPDLVYQSQSTSQVNVDYYDGTGGADFKGWACLSCGINVAGWTVVGASDFDGNGVPDLVYQNQTLGRLNVDYYGGSGGSVLKGWNALNNYTGWTVIVPKSR